MAKTKKIDDRVEIAAEGRAISSQNGSKIIGAITYLLDVVANSGILSPEDLQHMFSVVTDPGVQVPAHVNQNASGEPSGDLSGEPSGELSGELSGDLGKQSIQAESTAPIQASSCCLLTAIETRVWDSNLYSALDVYRMKSREVLFMSDDMFARAKYPKDRAKTLVGFIDDLVSFLTEAAQKYKPEYREGSDQEFRFGIPMMMAAREAEVQAGRFTDSLERRTWSSRLDTTIDIFKSYFGDLIRFPDAAIENNYNVKDRPAAVAKILKELKTALTDIIESFPIVLRACNDADRGKEEMMQLAAKEDNGEQVILEVVGLQLSAQDPSKLNRRPMEGMLFPIDSPSEATPAVGPGLPLFVPRNVAMDLVSRVSGLPLDAHDSLAKHANKQIVGVINAASIEGNEFRVNGYLYDWSNPEMVSLIAANKASLGMSMNAMAKGSPRDVNGRKVFYVESLQLMGANILKSNKATFTGTNLISAAGIIKENDENAEENNEENDFSSPDFDSIVGQLNKITSEELDPDDWDLTELPIDLDELLDEVVDLPEEEDRSLDNSYETNPLAVFDSESEEEEESDASDTEIQLSRVTNMTELEKLSAQMNSFAASVNETLGHLVQAQSVLADDYEQRQQLAAIQAAQQEQEDARYAAESIADLTIAKLQSMGMLSQQPIAAAGQDIPARRTVAIAASASTTTTEQPANQDLLLQLAGIDGQLNVLEDIPGTGEKMNALVQQAAEIRAKLGHRN
jgi:hypothetical protein